MHHNFLVANKKRRPILIFDRYNILATLLSEKLKNDYLPVIISEKKITSDDKIIALKLTSRLPRIPDNSFVKFIYVKDNNAQSEKILDLLNKDSMIRKIDLIYLSSIYKNSKKDMYYLFKSNNNVYSFLYGDFIQDFEKERTNEATIIRQAIAQKRIDLSSSGTNILHSSDKQTFLDILFRTVFIDKLSKGIYSDFHLSKKTELTLAREIISIDPDVRLNIFNKKSKKLKVDIPANIKIPPHVNNMYRENLKTILLGEYKDLKVKKTNNSELRTRISSIVKYTLISTFIFISIYMLVLVASFLTGAYFLTKSITSLKDLSVNDSSRQISISKNAFSVANSQIDIGIYAASHLGLNNLDRYELKIKKYETALDVISDLTDGLVVYKGLLVDKKEVSQNDFEAATYKIKESLIQINELRLSDEEFRKKTNSISQYGKLIDLYIATSDVLPEIFGYDSEKKYILVFQNNNELRPGGGFIGSFGLVSAKNGIYSEPEIHDVYEADGQLRGQIDPPLFLKKYMGITNWFLRDSNTEVDNIKNAENISRFTNLEMGEDVDGVITVDLNVIRGLLDITGPIEIEGYGKVTSENFDEFSQSLIQDNFFPGSKLKGTYLNDFSSALGKKLSVSQMSGVFKSLNDSLVNKSLTIVFKDENLQDPLTLYNVSSSPYMKRGKVGISNFTGINEANLSANKANNKIVRAIKHDIQVTNTGIVKNILNISLKNNSSVENDFEGIYKVYLRFLVPEGANVTSININGKDQIILAPITDPKEYEARGAIPENNIEVDRVNLGDLSSYGIYQEIGLGETNDINFTYELPDPLDLRSGEISLTNQIFMQPGTLDDSYTFVFRNPEGFTSKSSNKNLKTTSTGVYGVFKLNRDEDFNIKLNRS